MAPEIAIVVSPREWAERLHRFVADHGGARVRARILDGREALDEGYEVLVAEDLTSFLTPRLVDELRRRGRRILGVYDPVEPWGRERLTELGVDDTIELTATPEQFLRAVDALALTAHVDLDAELQRLGTEPERGATTTFEPARSDAPSDDLDGARPDRGTVTVVGGPSGAPGVTELCIGLAQAAARRRQAVVLVDADELAPSLAQRLGLPLHPNLRTAIDAVQHWSGRLSDTLTTVPVGGFHVLVGLPNTQDWSELRPGEVVDVVVELARTHPHVIVNVGHRLEELGGIGVTGRHGVSRALVAAADVVLGVCGPSPVALARYLEWIADVRALTRVPIHTAVNRAPSSAFKRGELEEELRRTYSPPTLSFVPFDKRVPEAEWAGELVPAGPFVKTLDSLAEIVLAPTAGAVTAAPAEAAP